MSDVKSTVPGFREDQVKAEAYRLWLEEGCPEGRAEAHWFQALGLINTVPAAAPKAKPKAVAAVKAPVRKRNTI